MVYMVNSLSAAGSFVRIIALSRYTPFRRIGFRVRTRVRVIVGICVDVRNILKDVGLGLGCQVLGLDFESQS